MAKLSLIVVTLILALSVTGFSAERNHRVVFEVSGGDPEQWQAVLANVENLQKAFGPKNTEIEVVAHGKGIGLLRTSNSRMADRLAQLTDSGVVLAACSNTMRRMKISKQDLFPFVTVVDSGVAEIVRKQEAGWAYLKGGS